VSTQSFFPLVPDTTTWENWNGNVLHYYGEQPIPYLPEVDWKIVAKNISQLPTFENYFIPSPDTFIDWRDWAREFTQAINGPSI